MKPMSHVLYESPPRQFCTSGDSDPLLSPVHSDYRGFSLAILNTCTCDLLPSSNIVRVPPQAASSRRGRGPVHLRRLIVRSEGREERRSDGNPAGASQHDGRARPVGRQQLPKPSRRFLSSHSLPRLTFLGRFPPSKSLLRILILLWYSWVDSNHRPPDPQSGALTN